MSVYADGSTGAFVQQRVAAILKRPDGWGPPHAVELQILLLVEVWHVAHSAEQVHIDRVSERFDAFCGTVKPGPPWPLAARCGLTAAHRCSPEFIELLARFVEQEGVR